MQCFLTLTPHRKVSNRYVGHAYLIDREGRVRWRARGQATQEHTDRMLEFTQALLDEAAAAGAGKAKPAKKR